MPEAKAQGCAPEGPQHVISSPSPDRGEYRHPGQRFFVLNSLDPEKTIEECAKAHFLFEKGKGLKKAKTLKKTKEGKYLIR